MAHRRSPLPRRALALTITALIVLPAPAALAQADTRDPAGAALATERYYSSYGTPPPPATSDGTSTSAAGPTWTAAIIVGSLLSVASAGIGMLAGRAGARPRHVTA